MSFMKRAMINVANLLLTRPFIVLCFQGSSSVPVSCYSAAVYYVQLHVITSTLKQKQRWNVGISFFLILGKLSPMSTQTCGICVLSL